MLTPVQESETGGVMPRNFKLDPTGGYLLSGNELSNNVVIFKIDPVSGKLTRTGKEITVDTPVCIQFVPVQP